MASGGGGLAAALTWAALVAPDRPAAAAQAYIPADASAVVARVPARDPREVVRRAELAAAPGEVGLAVELAWEEIDRARRFSDPRHLGRAQAILARWWKLGEPPPEILLARATIDQALHRFDAARADLDRYVRLRADDVQGHLTRAVVATVTGDYAAARDSCAQVERLASSLVARTCRAPLDALAGDPAGAYRKLEAVLDERAPLALHVWARSTLAELAIQIGDDPLAEAHLRAALAIDPHDAYALAALADLLLPASPGEASALLAGLEQVDTLLVRRAIGEARSRGPDAARLATMMRERFAAAAARDERAHLREQAMFALHVDGEPARAVTLARRNWAGQRELADARLLAEAAARAGDPDAAAPVVRWAKQVGVRDARLSRSFEQLGAAR